MESHIENFLKKVYPEVVLVKFSDKKVQLGSENKTITKRLIQIVIDPYGILNGNIKYDTTSTRSIHNDILTKLNDTFPLDLWTYGSSWDVDIHDLRLF